MFDKVYDWEDDPEHLEKMHKKKMVKYEQDMSRYRKDLKEYEMLYDIYEDDVAAYDEE